MWVETDTYVTFFSFLEDLKKANKKERVMDIPEISSVLSILFN